jgi:hypothetical protein
MTRSILLINTNVARPPVSPVGLEYVGEALIDAHLPVSVLDFSFASDWKASLQKQLRDDEPLAVGLSVRNTDDCSFCVTLELVKEHFSSHGQCHLASLNPRMV